MADMYRTQQDDRLDIICWNHYGRSRETVELVLEANPRLANHGPILPAGLKITLPNLPAQSEVNTVKLWD